VQLVRVVAVAMLFTAAPARAVGQDAAASDSLPFRRGQWAAAFQLESLNNFRGIGLIRFASAGRAWVVDWSLSGQTTSRSFQRSDSANTMETSGENNWSAVTRLGRRTYHSAGAHLLGFHTLGATAVAGWRRGTRTGLVTRDWSWRAGLFAEGGAAFLPMPRVSIGFTATIALTYGRQNNTADFASGPDTRSVGWDLSMSTSLANLVATLYF
jgi:hypothetical protein